MLGKFTFIKVYSVETIAVSLNKVKVEICEKRPCWASFHGIIFLIAYSKFSSLPVSNPTAPDTTSTSLIPTTTSQSSNLIYGQYPQYYQPTNSTNSPNLQQNS